MKTLAEEIEDKILGIGTVMGGHSNTPDACLTEAMFEKFRMSMGPAFPPPPQIVVTDAARVQWRKPTSKKRRIRRKWSARAENWRPRSLKIGNVIYMHPDEFKKLKSKMEGGAA